MSENNDNTNRQEFWRLIEKRFGMLVITGLIGWLVSLGVSVESRLQVIETHITNFNITTEKLDKRIDDNHLKIINHGNRLTKLEARSGQN
jgi:hypothetical protein